MKLPLLTIPMLLCLLPAIGCKTPPGYEAMGSNHEAATRPDQVTDFATLYGHNCAGCHGEHGQNGAAISLANPVYLATASEADLKRIISGGVQGTAMPAFAKSAGGTLTDQQVDALTQGMLKTWSDASQLGGMKPPAYASSGKGDAAHGQAAFGTYCGQCHGSDGTGNTEKHLGSLVDPTYLALVSDQGLRSVIISGQAAQGMPDWKSDKAGDAAHVLTDQEITDIVAWLASHRVQTPGQVYQHQ
jgi:cytochrome c oxidase cbb3-type subunit 3/ubiquinol-cytochrome c reductase cytochrome c subunit